MNNKLRFDFSVFYNCIIKNYSGPSQHYVINMLLTGNDDDYSDSACSNFGKGKRKIPKPSISIIQDPNNDNEILERIKNINIQSSECLSVFRDLVNSGYIEFDEIQKYEFTSHPSTKEELYFLLLKLLRYATQCPRTKIAELTVEQIALLENGISEITNSNSINEILSTNPFTDNYYKTLFWSNSDKNTLENLYVYNTYRFLNQAKTYDDLELLIEQFISEKFNDFLKSSKGIHQYVPIHILLITAFPGCGKTSLITKLAHEHATNEKMHFVSMAELKNSVVTMDTISQKLSVSKKQLYGSILILDSLDEAIKNSEDCDEILINLSEEFEEYKIKSLITCRSNLLTSNNIRSCLEIELQGFDSDKAITWLEKYYKINPDFHFNQWKYTVSHLDSTLSKVLLIPLILYICVVREIDITTVKDIGELYDILFNPINGQVAISTHRDHTNYKSKEWDLLRANISDMAIIMHQKGYIDKSDIVNDDMINLKKYFGLDFYVDTSSNQFRFVHASMWQYFVAERIYTHLTMLKSLDDVQPFLDNMLEIVAPQHTLDNLIFGFLNYFTNRDNWNPANVVLYKHILFHLSDYNINKNGNILTIISCLWRDLFKIFTHIFMKLTVYY